MGRLGSKGPWVSGSAAQGTHGGGQGFCRGRVAFGGELAGRGSQPSAGPGWGGGRAAGEGGCLRRPAPAMQASPA